MIILKIHLFINNLHIYYQPLINQHYTRASYIRQERGVIERQGNRIHMVKKEERKAKQQLPGPEPVTPRSIAYPLAAEPW